MTTSKKAASWGDSGNTLVVLVCGLLGASALALVLVAVGLVRQASIPGQRESLEYHTLLASIDEILALDDGSTALRFETVRLRLAERTITYDTLVIEPAGAAIPSLGVGGYLYEEVRRFNAFQHERVGLAAQDPDAFARLEPYNPSLFRSYRRSDGSLGVTRTAAAWNRRVQSPFGNRWSGDVRTGDANLSWSLYSASASVPLGRATRLSRLVNGRRRTCDFEPHGNDARAFCLSEARSPQVTLRGVGALGGPHRLIAGWSPSHVDGARVAPGDSVDITLGSIVQIDPLKPAVFGAQRWGVLSSQQWINGRTRRRGSARPPLDIAATLGRGPVDPKSKPAAGADVVLSVHQRATLELNEQLDAFVRILPIPIEFATVIVARVSDGAVVAMAEVGDRSEPGRSRLLERIVPGSAVKPILAAAILSQRPELGSLTIPARSGRVRTVAGAPTIPDRQAFTSSLNCGQPSRGRVNLTEYLRCSNNEFAATLLMRGLTTPGASVDPFHRTGATEAASPFVGRAVPRGTLLRSAFSEGMNALFEVSTDPTIADTRGRSRSVWTGLAFSDGTLARVPFEALPDVSRPALLGDSNAQSTDLSLLYRYAFGAWENRWNLFDLTTAFGRIVTDRRIQVTLAGTPGPEAEPLQLAKFDWYSGFLEGLASVPLDGTASGLARRWRLAGLPGTLFAKTGTLAEDEARRGSGLFIKSLLFAVGETEAGATTPLRCGLVGSVYLSFKEGPDRGRLPSYQVDFAERRLARFLAERWESFDACPESVVASSH